MSPGLTISATIVAVFGRLVTTISNLTVSATVAYLIAYKRVVTADLTIAITILKGWGRKITTTSAGLTASVSVSRKVAYKRYIPIRTLTITISSSDIDAALTDFPVLIYLSSSSGKNNTDVTGIFDELGSNSKKLRILTSTGQQCYVEIEKWNATNEKAWLHVKVPAIASDVDTVLTLQASRSFPDNNAFVGDTNSTPAENVWDNNFVAVYHMGDDPDTSHIRDSTNNNNDGTKTAAGEPALNVNGVIAEAQDFDNTDDYITCGVSGFATGLGTFELILKPTFGYDTADTNSIISLLDGSNNRIHHLYYHPGTDRFIIYSRVAGNVITSSQSFSAGDIIQIGHTWDKDDRRRMFLNGSPDGEDIGSYTPDVPASLLIGIYKNLTAEPLGGMLDEIRYSKIVRLDAWIAATKESLWDDLVAFGSPSSGLRLGTAVTLLKGWGRTIATTAGLTVAVTIAKSFGRTIATTANLSISVTVVKTWGRKITTSANLAISVTVNRVIAYKRAISAGLTVAVSLIRSFGFTVTTTANLTVSVVIQYCTVLRQLLRVPIDALDTVRLTISRMSISRVPISRKEIYRRIRSCFP